MRRIRKQKKDNEAPITKPRKPMKVALSGVHFELDGEIKDYVANKIGKLNKFMPEKDSDSAYAEVKLKGSAGRGRQEYTCEAIIHLPYLVVVVHKSADSMKAAIDLVEDNLKIQLKRSRDRKLAKRRRLNRFFRRH